MNRCIPGRRLETALELYYFLSHCTLVSLSPQYDTL